MQMVDYLDFSSSRIIRMKHAEQTLKDMPMAPSLMCARGLAWYICFVDQDPSAKNMFAIM